MNVLFIDKGNVARSRMAEIFFNNLSKKNKGASAGIDTTKWRGKILSEFAEPLVKCMIDEGYDVSKYKVIQLNKRMVDDSNLIISFESQNELPDYVKNTSKKLVIWRIDNPKEKSYEFHCKVRDKIKKLITTLVKEIG